MKTPKEKMGAREAIATFGTAIVVPVCFFGAIAGVADPAKPEAWWALPCLGGLAVWFCVVLPLLRPR
jgi:hypothetical protein